MATTDYHLIIESIRGETKRPTGDDGMDILRFELAADVVRDGMTGQAQGRRRYTDMKFHKILDKASPTIMQMLAQNAKIRKATLTCRKTGGHALEYYKIVLSDAYIASYKVVGADFKDEFGAIPREEFTINYRKIDVEYTKQNDKGGADGTVNFSDSLNQ